MFIPNIGSSYDTITVPADRALSLDPDFYLPIVYASHVTYWCSTGAFVSQLASRLIDNGTEFTYEYRQFTDRQARYMADC